MLEMLKVADTLIINKVLSGRVLVNVMFSTHRRVSDSAHQGLHGLVGHLSREPPKVNNFNII
jgi:hypothetical protein